jgi:site-specific DNA-methyltransferase (adenine-specific)
MPESVTDRPTKSHEYLFLLSKLDRYFYDAHAIREPQSNGTHERFGKNPERSAKRKLADAGSGIKNNGSFDAAMKEMFSDDLMRNKRSVWTVPTAPYSEAHFATFPPALIKPCIMAGCPVGGTVLDPFGGSGTTGMVALELGRKAILIELNPEYVALMRQRCDVTPGLAFV